VSFEATLRDVLAGAAPQDLPPDIYQRLERLDRLLSRFSSKIDLHGFRSEGERIRRYFAEPLAATARLPRAGDAVDIGSGGGSPGLLFAMSRPELFWTLLEPRRKRRLFLEEAVRELGIANGAVCGERFREGSKRRELSAISSRGVRLTGRDLDAVVSALSHGGRFLWMSGESQLLEARELLANRPGVSIEGPTRLLSREGAWLLVLARVE
jgi:16S rRNA G527 N7-methylase RsmG